ncbi:MAG: glycosyltransferase family 2 protein [Lachnospiraceae bacterium]|nr:glycosyltransferase family 2 protein [Lachnospiraceae bacterium]
MNQDKISIILPIYQDETAITRCMQSILSQTYETFELFLVEVEGGENASKLCREYAKKDNRVCLLASSYQSIGAARNAGLQAAKGRWVMFLDGTDYLAADYLMNMYSQRVQTDAELIISNFYYVKREFQCAYDNKVNHKITRDTYLSRLMKDPCHCYFEVLWNKMYDLKLIEEHSIKFPDKVAWGEDFIFNMQYLAYVKNIYILDQAGCYYVSQDRTAGLKKEWALIDSLNQRNYMYAAYKTLFWRLQLFDTHKKKIEMYMLRYAALEFAGILFPFSFKSWCLIRKKCLQDNQLNTIRNRLWVMTQGVKLRCFPNCNIQK